MTAWKRWVAAIALGMSLLGIAACSNPDEVDQPGDPEQVEEMEEQLDQVEEEVRDDTP